MVVPGTCDVNIVLTVELTQEEISKIVLDPKEYNDCTWVTPEALLASDYHPALQYSARALLAANKLAEIRELEKQGNADGKVLEALREYLKLTEDPACGVSPYVLRNQELNYEGQVLVTRY